MTPSRDLANGPRKLSQRRALVMRAEEIPSLATWIWVDDDGWCDFLHDPLDTPTFHHVNGRMCRCPASISEDEQPRIISDLPEGSINKKFRRFLMEKGFTSKKKPAKKDFAKFDDETPAV